MSENSALKSKRLKFSSSNKKSEIKNDYIINPEISIQLTNNHLTESKKSATESKIRKQISKDAEILHNEMIIRNKFGLKVEHSYLNFVTKPKKKNLRKQSQSFSLYNEEEAQINQTNEKNETKERNKASKSNITNNPIETTTKTQPRKQINTRSKSTTVVTRTPEEEKTKIRDKSKKRNSKKDDVIEEVDMSKEKQKKVKKRK